MFNKIISVILSLSLCINTCFAQESEAEDNWQLSGDTMQWVPVKKTLTFGNLRLAVWLLPVDGLSSPISGYVLPRSGVSDLLNITNNFQGRLDTVVAEERASCDTQLEAQRQSCIDQNKELRLNFDSKVAEIETLNAKIQTLDENVFLYKILAGVGGVAALSLGIFALSK